jgi:hypothetical protein
VISNRSGITPNFWLARQIKASGVWMSSPKFLLSSFFRPANLYLIAKRPFHQSMSSVRSYRDAIDHLNSLQSNAATLEAVRASGGRLSKFAIPEMLEYLERIGYAVSLRNSVNCGAHL